MSNGFTLRPISPFLADDQIDRYWVEHVDLLSQAIFKVIHPRAKTLAIVGAGKMNDLSRPVAALLGRKPDLFVDHLDYDTGALPFGKQRVIEEASKSQSSPDLIEARLGLKAYEATGIKGGCAPVIASSRIPFRWVAMFGLWPVVSS